MITKSGIDTKNFEYNSAGVVSEELYMSYTKDVKTGLFVLENSNGMEACITNVGARIVSLLVPDKDGKFQDVVLGFDSLKGYIDYDQRHSNVHGAVVGRYANRISNGSFTLNEKTYNLPKNNGTNCLHGGPYGWAFQTYTVLEHTKDTLKLNLKSPDGDMGFPGEVNFIVTYSLHDDNSLHINYEATTDQDTPINVTNHSYFNLSGNHANKIFDDELFINALSMTLLNENTCPNGQIEHIEYDSPFDFYGKFLFWAKYLKQGKPIGKDINANNEQIKLGNGYDHNFVLQDKEKSISKHIMPYNDINFCAKLHNNISGITMNVYTDQPGVQLYDSVDLDGTLIGKKGVPIDSCCGLCLETQHFADSPNISHFPSTILKKDNTFKSVTVYKFSKE